jgi:16S rRNA (uracil1498-N3)-methyltransferase
VYEAMPRSPESPVGITLACAVLARQRMITVAQKATELGVTRLVPIFSEHSVGPAGLAHEKAHAWPGQLHRAARQCRRGSVPELTKPIALERFVEEPLWCEADRRFMLDDRTPSAVEALHASGSGRAGEIVFAVGPEGGWSDVERTLLASSGASPLRLGGRVLRAETAVFAGLTVLQYALGDLAPGSPDR